jgi:hypothetical protein
MADLKLIGAVAVKVRPDASGFKEGTRRQVLKELAGQEYDVVVNLDLVAQGIKEKAKRIVQQVKRETDESIGLRVGVDPDSLRKASADIGKVLKDFRVSTLKVEMDREYLRKAGAQLNSALNEASAAGIKVDVSTTEGLNKAKRDIDEFLKGENGQEVKLNTFLAGLQTAAAQLKYATRARKVDFFVNVNQKSLAVAEGLFKSLAGLGALTTVGQRLESLIANFDKFSVKSAGWATAIAGLVNTITFLGTSMFTVGEGVVQSIGILATLPTALAAVAAGVIVNVAAFKDFKSAIDGDAKALAALPPEARAAAKALQGTWTSIQKPVQKAFWVGMGESIQRFAKNTIPVLRDGLTSVADDVGRFNAGILDSFEEIARNGDMKKMFGNLEGFFGQATAASRPFFDALNTFGLRGSDYLPRFGKWLADISNGFKDWAVESDKAGKINVWIEKGVQSLKDMGGAGKAIVGMFQGITRAVNDAGGGGLPEFRKNMESIADTMKGEPFRSRMATIFAGARKGATELNVGVKDLGNTLGRSAGYMNELLVGLGKLGGGVLSGLAATLGQLQFQTGTLEGVRDMQEALGDLAPSFEGLGRIIGNMSRVSGEIFKGIAPVVNTIVGFLDRSIGTLTGNLEKLSPALMGMVNALLVAASGPLGAIVDGLNGLIGGFNGLPRPLQLATAAFLTFLALRGPLGSFITNMQTSFGKLRGVQADGTRQMTTLTASMARATAESNIAIRRFDGSPMVRQLHTIGQKSIAVGRQIGGSLMAFAGGPWGLALAGAGLAITMMGDAAAKQKAKIDDLRTSLNGQTGINKATQEVIATQLRAKDSFLWMSQGSIADNAEKIGVNLRDLQKAAEGVPESIDAVTAAIKRASNLRNPFETVIDTLKPLADANAFGPLSGVLSQIGTWFGSAGGKTATGLREVVDTLKAARLETEKFAQQLGVPTNVSAGIIAAVDTLVSKASTADEKLRAVNDIIRQMNGESDTDDAIQKSNDTVRDFGKNLAAIVETAKGEGLALPDLFDKVTGKILTTSAGGSALRTELKKVADDGRIAATRLAQAQADPQKAIETLRTEMEKTREKIAAPLRLAGVPPEEIEKILAQLNLDPALIEITLKESSEEQMLADLKAANDLAKSSLTPAIMPLDADKSKFDQVVEAAKAKGIEFGGITPTPKLDGDPTKFDGIIAAAKGTGVDFGGKTYTPGLNADKTGFDGQLDGARGAGAEFDKAVYTAQADVVGNALKTATDILNTLGKIDGSVVQAGINILGKVLGESANGSMHDGMNWNKRFAPKFYANGGIENHIAQIAKPSSTLRVWAEPETGGEAYIPLAASKRSRSTAILDEVANKFGYELYAKGGIRNGNVASTATGGGLSVHIDAAPGVAYQYAREVATEATTKLRDMQAVYDFA